MIQKKIFNSLSIIIIAALMLFGQSYAQNTNNKNLHKMKNSKTEHYTFQLSDNVTR